MAVGDEEMLLPSGWTFKTTPCSKGGSFAKRKRVIDLSLRVLDES